MSFQNENAEIAQMYLKWYKGFVNSKEYLEQKNDPTSYAEIA